MHGQDLGGLSAKQSSTSQDAKGIQTIATTIICKLFRTPTKAFTHNHGAGKLRIHVTVVDLRDETHFGRFEGILNRKVHLQEEHPIRVRRVRWTSAHSVPMKQVLTNLRQLQVDQNTQEITSSFFVAGPSL
jgi:hypothetical protein